MKKCCTPPVVSGISSTQSEFDRYQREAFGTRTPNFFALELCGECGELANREKKVWRDSSKPVPQDKLEGEAADVLIALLNYCNSRDIDLEKAVKSKLDIIESRRVAGKMGTVPASDNAVTE